LAVGGLETAGFKHQTYHFHELLVAKGLPVRLVQQPDCHHFNLVNELADPSSELLHAVLALLQ
jgi:arylformamidase